MLNLKDNAIIISDVHYDVEYRKYDFEKFISKLDKNPPPQLIFLGDIFDLLFGNIKYSKNRNSEMIRKINILSQKTEILYFEGNHDFNLKDIFPQIYVIAISQQPIKMRWKNIDILFSHGDYSVKGVFYFYRRLIEKKILLRLLNIIDSIFNNRIIKNIEKNQIKKRKCYKIRSFKDIIKRKLKNVESDFFIDGHYHQGKRFNINGINYINIFSFACNQTYFIVKSKHNSIFFKSINLKDF